MQQRSFREMRVENERKKKTIKKTMCLINKQGLRCYEKETIDHSAVISLCHWKCEIW